MNSSTSAALLLAGTQSLALAGQLAIEASVFGKPADPVETQVHATLQARASFEESWIKLPDACKARVFNADPVAAPIETASLELREIYDAFKA